MSATSRRSAERDGEDPRCAIGRDEPELQRHAADQLHDDQLGRHSQQQHAPELDDRVELRLQQRRELQLVHVRRGLCIRKREQHLGERRLLVAQALSGYTGTTNMNYLSFSTSPSPAVQSVSSVTSTTYTTFSAAYGESGSIGGTQAMPQITLASSSFNVSSTNITTDNSSNSMTSTVLAPSGMFTLTMTDTTNSTFSGDGTTSMIASQTSTPGVTNETVNGGTSDWYSANYTTTQNGATAQTITTASSTSGYTDTYSPSSANSAAVGRSKERPPPTRAHR